MNLLFKATIVIILSLFVKYLLTDWLLLRSVSISENVIKNKNVFITGASMGIGKEISLIYCKFGANLVITARTEDKLKQIQKECKDLGNPNVHLVTGDMNVTQDVDSVAAFVRKVFSKGIDHVILNHVAPYVFRYFNGDMDFLRLHTQVDVVSYIQLTAKLLPLLSHKSGSLVVVSSMCGKFPTPFFAVYSGAKFAVGGFFHSVRHGMRAHGSSVSIGVVILGATDTDSAVNALSELKQNIPMASTHEVAEVVVKTAVSRAAEVYFPVYGRTFHLLYKWFERPLVRLIKLAYPGKEMEKTWPQHLYQEN